MNDEKRTYKLNEDAIKAFSTLFLKVLVEQKNVQEELMNLELSVEPQRGDKVLGYLNIDNPPKAIQFTAEPEEETDEEIKTQEWGITHGDE